MRQREFQTMRGGRGLLSGFPGKSAQAITLYWMDMYVRGWESPPRLH